MSSRFLSEIRIAGSLVKMKHNESLKVVFADDDKRRASIFSSSEAGSEYCKKAKFSGPLRGTARKLIKL